jgi:hypothetical protein
MAATPSGLRRLRKAAAWGLGVPAEIRFGLRPGAAADGSAWRVGTSVSAKGGWYTRGSEESGIRSEFLEFCQVLA